MPHTQNYLQHVESEQVQQKRKRTKMVRRFFVLFFVVLVVWVLGLLVATFYVTTHVVEARNDIIQAKSSVQILVFEEAKGYLREADDSLVLAKRVLPLIRSVSWVPFAGAPIKSFADVIDSSEAFIEAFMPLVDLGSDLMRLSGVSGDVLEQIQMNMSPNITFDDLSTQTKRAILQRLSASADDLDLLVAQLTILDEEIQLLSHSVQIGPLLSVLDPVANDLEEMGDSLKLLAISARLLPSFAGLEEPTFSLLLFLNNTELRPAGGFIGTYGVMEMFGGEISHLETADVYELDNAVADVLTRQAPVPLQTYNNATTWFFRDSNWSPDFASASAQSVSMFLEEVGLLEEGSSVPSAQNINQVIGFTPTFASDLLRITGSITVGGQTFTSENVADLLEYRVEFGYAQAGIPEAQRKEILADLVNEMKARLYALPAKEWPAVLVVVQQALQEKQILLYSTNEQVQKVLARVGWDGGVNTQTADTLMVVDANLAGLKSDPAVERHTTYSFFENASGQWVGRVALNYQHHGVFDWKTTRYRTYTRVFVPEGTKLLDVEGSWLNDKTQNPTRAKGPVDVVDELGLTSFGTFTSIEPGQENTLTFTFLLSPQVVEEIASGTYNLTILKQAGAQNNALTLGLDFDKNVTHAVPAEDENEWGDAGYRLNTILDQDLEVHLSL